MFVNQEAFEEVRRHQQVTKYEIYPLQSEDTEDYQVLAEDIPSLLSEDNRILQKRAKIPFWTEEKGKAWSKIAKLMSKTPQQLFVLSGNPSASSASNGTNTFELFDDFAKNMWQVGGAVHGEHGITKNNKLYMTTSAAGYGLQVRNPDTGALITQFLDGDNVCCSPIIDSDGYIYVHDLTDLKVYKINESTGIVANYTMSGGSWMEALAYDEANHRILILDGTLKSINCSDMTLAWSCAGTSFSTGSASAQPSPLIIGDYVYARNKSGVVYKVNKSTGALVTSQTIGSTCDFASIIYDADHDRIIIPNYDPATVYYVNPSDLSTVWSKNLGAGFYIKWGGCYHANKAIFPARESSPYPSKVFCLDVTDSGNILWTNTEAYDANAAYTNILMDDDYVYAPSHDYADGDYRKLVVINLSNGTTAGTFSQMGESMCHVPIPYKGNLVLGIENGGWQLIKVRSSGTYSETKTHKVDHYYTGYAGSRLSGSLEEDGVVKWVGSAARSIQDGIMEVQSSASWQYAYTLQNIPNSSIIRAKSKCGAVITGYQFGMGWGPDRTSHMLAKFTDNQISLVYETGLVSTWDIIANTYYIWEHHIENGYIKKSKIVSLDSNQSAESIGNIDKSLVSAVVGISVYIGVPANIDWIAVRKYASPEPLILQKQISGKADAIRAILHG